MRRLVACLPLLIAGCATAPSNPLPPALAPFAEASRFVPDGMQSFAFLEGSFATEPGPADCVVWAGRDFEVPTQGGIGSSRSISISDFGSRGFDADGFLIGADAEPVLIAGHPCRRLPPTPKTGVDFEQWGTVVDGRFGLLCPDRELLARALQRRGNVATLLVSFGDLSFVPSDATHLIFNLPRPGEPYLGEPVPKQPMVFVFTPAPARFWVFSREEPAKDYETMLNSLWTADPQVRQCGEWQCRSERTDPQLMQADHLGAFFLVLLFGHQFE